ncbi:MAG: DUF4440 domain-containing protein [Candidatus Dactylopiibacterium carminicum]|nr:MAG: DUF4440 domain-containing protein [Candidatus Dactylopiibacterium carminicum]
MRRQTFSRSRFCIAALLALVSTAFPLAASASIAEAQALLAKRQQAQALEKVERVLAGNPRDRQARFLKGVILAEMNKLDDAASTFIKLTEEAPELPEPYNNLAVIYAQQNQLDKARAALEMAIRTHPLYAVAHENLGDLYTKMARQAYDRALQIDSRNTNAQAKLNLLRDISSAVAPRAQPAVTRPVTVAAVTATSSSSSTSSRASSSSSSSSSAQFSTSSSAAAIAVASSASARSSSSTSAASSSAPAVAQQNQTANVRRTVQNWAAAWSAQNAQDYLGYYAKGFEVPGGKSRKDWEAERADRINRPKSIRVNLTDLSVSVDGNKAVAKFRQQYESDALKTATGKTLDLQLQDGRWLILRERIGR